MQIVCNFLPTSAFSECPVNMGELEKLAWSGKRQSIFLLLDSNLKRCHVHLAMSVGRSAPELPQSRVADSVWLPASPQGRGGGQEEEGGVRGLRGPVLQQQGGGHPQGHFQVRC